jgi:hypothetical protein
LWEITNAHAALPSKRLPSLKLPESRYWAHRSNLKVLFANDIVLTHVDQFFRSEQEHLQPDPALADPDNYTWNPLYPAANHEGTFLLIEPDHSIARFQTSTSQP